MQDRYAGDVGDFGKIGLLKCLQAQGFNIGVNWYRVPTLKAEKNKDGLFKQDDGKYLVPASIAECDLPLAKKLTEIATGNRSVEAIQKADLIPNAVYYSDYLTVEDRARWHEKAKETLSGADLVFMDPDNGLLVDSVGKNSARSIKYAFYEEVKDYFDSGKSVLVYNHRCRKKQQQYFDEIEDKIQEEVKVYNAVIRAFTFPKGSIRDYFAIPACKEHYEMICDAFIAMKNSKWGELGACRLYPEWAEVSYMRYMTYDDYYFLDVESENFIEGCTFEEYKNDVVRYLMKCGYQYTKESAESLVKDYARDIRGSYIDKEPVASLAIDIGYGCG